MILRLGELKKGLMKSRLEEVIITQTTSSWKQDVLLLPIHRCYVLDGNCKSQRLTSSLNLYYYLVRVC